MGTIDFQSCLPHVPGGSQFFATKNLLAIDWLAISNVITLLDCLLTISGSPLPMEYIQLTEKFAKFNQN